MRGVFRFWLLAALAALPAAALQARERKNTPVAAEGAERINVQIDFAAGKLRIDPGEIAEAAVFDFAYDEDKVDCAVDYEVRGGVGMLQAESERLSGSGGDTGDNEWEVVFSRAYPMNLSLDIGACDAEIELGGLRLEEVAVEFGAASAEIGFREPNPARMRELRFEAGASSVTATDLGNANFESCEFEGGVGSFDLDFRGEYHGESEIRVKVGLGSAEITLPVDIPCRIEGPGGGLLSSVEIHGGGLREIADDVWESDDYAGASTRLRLILELGLGAVDVRFR